MIFGLLKNLNPILAEQSLIEKLLLALKIGGEDGSKSLVYMAGIIIISVAVVLMCGFLMTRLTKLLKLPNVTAYIVAGIIIGPSVINIVPSSFISGTEFLSDIALAFIAFGAGQFFKLDVIKKTGLKTLIVTLFESLGAFALVFLVTRFALNLDPSFALVLSALSAATAPASTIMTIKQTGAKGEYVNTLLQVIAFDDVITLVLYSIAISICVAVMGGKDGLSFAQIGLPIIYNIICIIIGFALGFALKWLLPNKRSNDNRLIIVIAVIFFFCGICILFNQSPLLGCMAIGIVYTNTNASDDKLFNQVNYFTPPIMLLFFVRSGMNFNLKSLVESHSINGMPPLVVIAVVYFVVRIAAKYIGAFLGSSLIKSDKKIRNYLGFGLIPQAGVAIGLAASGARTFISSGQVDVGMALNTIILASSVLYELIGPTCAKLGLYLSKSYSNDINEVVPVETLEFDKRKKRINEVDKLVKQIQKIQEEMPEIIIDEDEEAFNEAAEEYATETMNGFLNSRRRY